MIHFTREGNTIRIGGSPNAETKNTDNKTVISQVAFTRLKNICPEIVQITDVLPKVKRFNEGFHMGHIVMLPSLMITRLMMTPLFENTSSDLYYKHPKAVLDALDIACCAMLVYYIYLSYRAITTPPEEHAVRDIRKVFDAEYGGFLDKCYHENEISVTQMGQLYLAGKRILQRTEQACRQDIAKQTKGKPQNRDQRILDRYAIINGCLSKWQGNIKKELQQLFKPQSP